MVNIWKQPVAAVALINAGVALAAFFKDILLAAYIGTSLHADALMLALFLPDSFGNNMLAASISVACVPVFSRLAAGGDTARLSSSVKQVTILFLAISLLMTVLGYVFAGNIVSWLGGGAVELTDAALPLFRIFLPIAVLYIAVAIGTAVLQTFYRFTVPALAPLAANLMFLLGVVYCFAAGVPIAQGAAVIAAVITASAAVMAAWIGRDSFTVLKQSARAADVLPGAQGWKDMMSLFVPYAIVLFSTQAVYLAERYMLSSYETGAVAALNYAFRLSQFPIWVFVAAVSAVILPALSKRAALGEAGEMKSVMAGAFRSVILIALPAMLFLYVLREPVTVALFQRGAFDERSVYLTAGILEGYSLTILSQALSLICLRYFLAVRRMGGAVSAYIVGAAATVASDAVLIRTVGVHGIGYGAMLGAGITALLLLLMYGRSVGLNLREALGNLYRYTAVLIPPVLLLPVLLIVWIAIPDGRSITACLFIVGSGSLYLLIYWLAMKRFWPSLAVRFIMRKG